MPIQMKMFFPLDRHPPAEAWEEAFVYLDEQHPTPEDESFAIGLLMMPCPLPQAIIEGALRSLPRGSNAVRRGYFHAIDDGRDAQTALADAIGTHMNAAEFRAFRW